MSKTTNTAKEPKLDWLFGGNPGAIEAQEARGQQELTASSQLPKKCNSPRGINATEQYHKMGIKTFTSSKGDDLFIGTKLPDGWELKPTDHSMWNNLVDDKGRVRATIFYKAAFYDRDSFINFETRYQTGVDYSDKESRTYTVIDTSTKEVIFRTDKHSSDCKDKDYFQKQDQYSKECRIFLNENFPLWEDVNAYW